jgi:hypothetical protein
MPIKIFKIQVVPCDDGITMIVCRAENLSYEELIPALYLLLTFLHIPVIWVIGG